MKGVLKFLKIINYFLIINKLEVVLYKVIYMINVNYFLKI